MDVDLEIPEELARRLASDAKGLARAALEAIALEGVRSGKLTVSQARRLLGIESRYEMDGFLCVAPRASTNCLERYAQVKRSPSREADEGVLG